MKKSLYIRIRNKALGLLFILMPYFFCTTTLAGPSSYKADYGSINLTDQAVSSFTLAVKLNNQNNIIPDSSLNSFIGSSQYTIHNLLNRNSKPNFVSLNALAAPPTIVCPGPKVSNTDPGFCRASISGLAATINDTDGDITTLTWTMSGATIAASPISGINNIVGSFNFNKGVTTVTYRVTDALGATTTCNFTVTVSDKEIPTIICPPDTPLTIPSCALLTDSISFSLLSVSDNCGILNFSSNAPIQFPVGITSVTWTANDINGNSAQCIQTVTVTKDPPVTAIINNQTNVACVGSATGSVTVSGNGGTPPYEYNINGGVFQASGTFDSLIAGTYNIIVKDANNCPFGLAVTITQSATALTASVTSHTNVLCSGQANGNATVTASGGTSPYTYSWNTVPVQTAATAINLTARVYIVTVKDATGCTVTANVTITQPTPLIVTIINTNVACNGDSTGSATASTSGGTPPYTYAWLTAPIQTTATVSNLPAGTYTVAVFDSSGCFKPAFVTITQPATKLTASFSQVNAVCGGNTGSITVTGSGGTPPYQYNINGGAFQASGTFNNLAGGSYTVIVMDANNCTFPVAVTIIAPALPLTATISHTNVLCSGQANGNATVTASGGTAPYTYSWNTVPVQTAATAINLTARVYIVTVMDASGCTATANVTITQPTPLIVTIIKTNVACNGDSTGSATASTSGGTPPYTYAWLTAPIQTTATVSNLPAGTYTVAVFDSLGCFKPAFVTITQPATKLTASITLQKNVDCSGNNTGLLTVAGSGGVPPYQYNINGGAFQANGTFNNLTVGSYTIIARDANNCTFIVPATITEPALALTALISSQTNVDCSGQNTGSATVIASGGTSPYTYSWNTVPVQTAPTVINLTASSYTVTVQDAAGCSTTANVTITQPTPLNVTTTNTNVTCFGDSTGTATALASGGTPPYSYAWLTTPIQTTATASNLPVGTYTVTVFDSLGCFKPALVTITQPATIFIALITLQKNVDCAGNNNGLLTVAGSGGVPPYQYNINGGAFQASGTFNNLAGGSYLIIARDANNCTLNIPVTILEPALALTALISSQTNVDCSGQNTGSANVTASGGTSPYSYSWNTVPVQTASTAINLTASNYSVIVTDAAGCTAPANVTITQPTPLVATITSTNVECFGDSTGTATALASGGTPPYTYAWLTTPIQTTATASNLPVGTYTVTVFDSLGCLKPALVTITQPATKLTASFTQQNVVCGGNTGSITITGIGGTPPYQYNINGGAFQASGIFNSLSAGIYNVIARDANNCTFNVPVTITEPVNALNASISQTNVLCVGQANGSAIVTAVNGSAPYSFMWNTVPVQTNDTISNLAVGYYIVTTTDNAGCFVTDTAFITEPAFALTAAITNQVNYDCASGTNGSVTIAGIGGTPAYQFSLNGGPYQVNGTFTNLPVGIYTVTVRDTNNCETPVPVEITVSGLILAVNDDVTTSEDTQVNGNVMANDQVICNLPIIVTANTSPQHGTVIVNADGSFTYTPSLNYNGIDSFTYTITDNVGGVSTASEFIIINPVNDSPVTFNESITVNYNLPKSENVLVNGDYDPDSTALDATATAVVDPVNGTFVIAADGSFTYTPNLNYIGNDMVIVSVCDAGIPLPPACTSDTIFIVVLPPNNPPTTVNENIVVCQNGSFTGTVSNGGSVFNGETDPENNLPITLSSSPVQGPAHGIFTITDTITGTFNYSPTSGYSGSDVVIVRICDSGIPVECSNDTVYIEIIAVEIADAGISQKLCNSDVATLVGNSPATGTASWTFVSGPNVPVISPSTGNVAIASGLISSTTPYIFGYSINTGTCLSTDTMSVINYAPATPAYAGIDQNLCSGTGNQSATLAGNTPANGTGTWTQLSGPSVATIQDTTNPNTDVLGLTFGIYSFQWLISNGVCQANADVVNISVSQPAVVNAGIDLPTCESTPVQVSGSSVLNSSSILWTTTGNGTFDDPTIINPVYTPGSLDLSMGTVKLTLNATGISPCGDGSDFAVLTINKKPVINAGPDDVGICMGNSKTISLANASDYSNLQWSVSPVSAGTILNAETLNPTFTPAAGFSGTAILILSAQGFGACNTSEIADTMNIVVNTSLVADAGPVQTILPGTVAILAGTVTGGSGFYAWSWQPADLLINSLSDKPVTVALNSATTFTLTVLDISTGCTANDSVQILIDNEGNPIVAVADHDTTLVNVSVTIHVLENDLNPDKDPLIVSFCGFPLHGLVILNSDSTITYTPYSDYEGDDEFCYRICSATNPSLCSESTVYVNIKHPSLDDLFVYNGISPNLDGLNDVWKIKGIEKYPNNTVLIFNRWGDKLREFANYNNTTHSWDGKNENGDPLPDGTYFYILDVKDVGVLKGWIYIKGK